MFMVAILTTSNFTCICICLLHSDTRKSGIYSCYRDVKGKCKLFPLHDMQVCRGSGGRAPLVLKRGNRCRRMTHPDSHSKVDQDSHPRVKGGLYPPAPLPAAGNPGQPWNVSPGGLQTQSGSSGGVKNLLPPQGLNRRTFSA
jgi:hypothetical protein